MRPEGVALTAMLQNFDHLESLIKRIDARKTNCLSVEEFNHFKQVKRMMAEPLSMPISVVFASRMLFDLYCQKYNL